MKKQSINCKQHNTHLKTLFSLLLSLLLIVSTVSLTSVPSYATSRTQNDAVRWAKAQIGKKLDYDGVYGAQCVDLIKYYYKYLGVQPQRGNGCDYAHNPLPANWVRIPYHKGFVAQPGDIAVWTRTSSAYGHVAIVVSATSNNMTVVEQNGSSQTPTRSHTYTYTSMGTFYGVIRPNFGDKRGWQCYDGTWYYFNDNGDMHTGWLKLGETWYYLNSDGTMHIGWLKLGETWYYLDSSGAMLTGWQWINDKCYYFYSNGAMAADTTIDGYYVDSSGAWIP